MSHWWRWASLLVPAAAAAMAATQEGPLYMDLRLQGGITGSQAQQVSIGFFGADLSEGERDGHYGLVLGVRACASTGWKTTEVDDSSKVTMHLAGGQALAGLAFEFGRRDTLELLGIYGAGIAGDHRTPSKADLVGHYREYGGEIGWQHLFGRHIVGGVTAGYSMVQIPIDNGTRGGEFAGSGIAVSFGMGYRF